MQKMRTRAGQPRVLPLRVAWLDRQRGVAILLMIVYHFSFDLDQYRYIRQDFNEDPRWLAFRALIVCLFMSALGASVALAYPARVDPRKLISRQVRLGLACIAVTLGSAWMFPASFIWFGILHFAWLATLLALPLRGLGWPLLPLAAVVAWLGNARGAAIFDTPWLGWIGLMTHKPITEDYVPLLPWFAAVLVGLYAAPFFQRHARKHPQRPAPADGSPALSLRADGALRQVGRRTLLIYLLHQPILIGLLEIAQRARPAG